MKADMQKRGWEFETNRVGYTLFVRLLRPGKQGLMRVVDVQWNTELTQSFVKGAKAKLYAEALARDARGE